MPSRRCPCTLRCTRSSRGTCSATDIAWATSCRAGWSYGSASRSAGQRSGSTEVLATNQTLVIDPVLRLAGLPVGSCRTWLPRHDFDDLLPARAPVLELHSVERDEVGGVLWCATTYDNGAQVSLEMSSSTSVQVGS
jgi:hypothetical protein